MSQLMSLAGWYFLPSLVSGWIQTILYSIFIRAGEPHPQPGSDKFVRHRRTIQACVVLLYLAYTVYEMDWQLQREGDFYSILGVSHGAEERRVRSVARRLLAQSHPDKASDASDQFIAVRAASDVLSDPIKRWAYDRFGPTVLSCKHCITVNDYVFFGFNSVYPNYVASVFGLGALYFLGYVQSGKYWRFLAIAILFVCEAFVATRSTWPRILTHIVNPLFSTLRLRREYLPFQAMAVARKLSLTLFIAHAQIMPLLWPPRRAGNKEQQLRQNLDQLELMAKHNDQEAGRILGLELTPFSGDETEQTQLQQRLKEWLVQNTVASQAQVRNARGRAIERKRLGVPHGAQGTM